MSASQSWAGEIYTTLKKFDVRQLAYVPDSGHSELLRRADNDPEMAAILLTSEEEGVGVLAGAWLGGQRGVLAMQSSGVGNCLNLFSLVRLCQLPFLALVTMRGEWGEFNPWQVPMGKATQETFELMDVQVQRADRPEEVAPVVQAACLQAYEGGAAMAVLLGQRLIGSKEFRK